MSEDRDMPKKMVAEMTNRAKTRSQASRSAEKDAPEPLIQNISEDRNCFDQSEGNCRLISRFLLLRCFDIRAHEIKSIFLHFSRSCCLEKNQLPTKKKQPATDIRNKLAVTKPIWVPVAGDLCFAKVRGYVEWPALVIEAHVNFAWVRFFGAAEKEQNGKVTFKNIYNIFDGLKFLEKNKKNRQLMKAVGEMEYALQLTNNNIFKEYEKAKMKKRMQFSQN